MMAEVGGRKVLSGGVAQNDTVMLSSEASPQADIEAVRGKLRQRWELASVLNFLNVFKPIIGKDLNITAEDIEIALIEQNTTLADLHISLLKGILPANQSLNAPDAWIIALSKALSVWWPWVAEGDFPLAGSKGEIVSFYKELEPITRLVMLKALCEVRADQYDAADYVNNAMKDGTDVSHFQKKKLASDGGRVTFWYDGSEIIGHRLYKEVRFLKFERGKGKATIPEVKCQWETLATNLEEFQKIVNDLSSSKVEWEANLSKSVVVDVIPVLEKQRKKKQRVQQQQQRAQMLLDGFRTSVRTRSFRNCKPVDYKFDNFDKAIKEAIKYTNGRMDIREQREEEKPRQFEKKKTSASDESNSSATGSDESEELKSEGEDVGAKDSVRNRRSVHFRKQNKQIVNKPRGMRFSKRLAGLPGHIPETVILGAKNRLRQRPSVNTAF